MKHGDSSLDFEIRAFVASLSHRLITTHELNTRINATLAAAGIEIPFPQRDVHVREIVRRSVNDEVAERLSQT
jgi:potassium efflux system protein